MESRSLLISDVDGTLLGDDAAVAEFADWYEARRDGLGLVYSSGRFVDSVRKSIDESPLPVPDAIIGGVGTDIWLAEADGRLNDWPNVSSWDTDEIRAICLAFSQLEPQPDHLQSRFKISFYGYDQTASFLDRLQRRLAKAGYAVEVVYSSLRDLDVLPAGTNKGTAAAWLARRCGNANDDVIVCGDSGNDLAMFQQGFRGVVVANARDELKQLVADNVYHSPLPYAAGVLDGAKYWLDRAAPNNRSLCNSVPVSDLGE